MTNALTTTIVVIVRAATGYVNLTVVAALDAAPTVTSSTGLPIAWDELTRAQQLIVSQQLSHHETMNAFDAGLAFGSCEALSEYRVRRALQELDAAGDTVEYRRLSAATTTFLA